MKLARRLLDISHSLLKTYCLDQVGEIKAILKSIMVSEFSSLILWPKLACVHQYIFMTLRKNKRTMVLASMYACVRPAKNMTNFD